MLSSRRGRAWIRGVAAVAVVVSLLWGYNVFQKQSAIWKKRRHMEAIREKRRNREQERLARRQERSEEAGASWAVHMGRGDSYAATGDYDSAVEAYRSAIALAPALAPAHMNLATVLLELDLVEEAIVELETAVELSSKPRTTSDAEGRAKETEYATALLNLGVARMRQGSTTEALEAFRKAGEADVSSVPARSYAATAALALGAVDEAADFATQTLELSPGHGVAALTLIAAADAKGKDATDYRPSLSADVKIASYELEKNKEEDDGLPSFLSEDEQQDLALRKREIPFVSFELLDRAGDTEGAWKALEVGNARALEAFEAQGRDKRMWTPAGSMAAAKAIMKTFMNQDYAVAPLETEENASAPLPVLLVGAPRAGATLLAAALSRAAGVKVRGADGALNDIVSTVGISAFDKNSSSYDERKIEALGAEYMARLSQGAPAATKVVIEALVDNVFWVGAAFLALKGRVRVVVVRRKDADAQAFSIFKTLFSQHGREWTCDPVSIRARLLALRHLEQMWLDKLAAQGGALLVDYEDLVEEPETQLKGILSFLKLDYTPDVLEPHLAAVALPNPYANAGAIRQPGFRKPKTWKHYMPYFFKRIQDADQAAAAEAASADEDNTADTDSEEL